MGKEIYIGGKLIEKIEGDYQIISNSDIEYNCNLFEAEGIDKGLSYNQPEDIDFGNAFIPVVSIIPNEKDYQYKNKEGVWKLDVRIDNDKRSPQMQRVRLISTKAKVMLKFKVEKGNKTADDDTGIITADIYSSANQKIESKKIKTSYGNTFEIEIESFKTSVIKFYADDDDYSLFNGGVSHVFCGGIRIGDCQDELRKETSKSLKLSLKDKALFRATVLVEASQGLKGLYDIAYIYLNNVIDSKMKIEKGLFYSSAYRYEQYMFKVNTYYQCLLLNINPPLYADDKGTDPEKNLSYGVKVKDYAKSEHFIKYHEMINKYCEFMEKNIFCQQPQTYYLGWHNQGNRADLNINNGRDNRMWDKARQYYWLQKQCRVEERLVVELIDFRNGIRSNKNDATTFIFNLEKIVDYFNKHAENLPSLGTVKLTSSNYD